MDIGNDGNHTFEMEVRLIMSTLSRSRAWTGDCNKVIMIVLLHQSNSQGTAQPGQVVLTDAESSLSTLGERVPGSWLGRYT